MGADESEVAISRGTSGQKCMAISYSGITFPWDCCYTFFPTEDVTGAEFTSLLAKHQTMLFLLHFHRLKPAELL